MISFDRRLLLYCFFGFIGASVELATFLLLTAAEIDIILSHVVAFHLAFVICFYLNYHITFVSDLTGRRGWRHVGLRYIMLMYLQVGFGAWLISWLTVSQHWPDFFAKSFQLVITVPASYILQSKLVFSSK